jgi:hypothetical protein
MPDGKNHRAALVNIDPIQLTGAIHAVYEAYPQVIEEPDCWQTVPGAHEKLTHAPLTHS